MSGHGSVSISSKKRWQARFGLWGIVYQPCTGLYRRKEKKMNWEQGRQLQTKWKDEITDGNTAGVQRR